MLQSLNHKEDSESKMLLQRQKNSMSSKFANFKPLESGHRVLKSGPMQPYSTWLSGTQNLVFLPTVSNLRGKPFCIHMLSKPPVSCTATSPSSRRGGDGGRRKLRR
uniref:Uncharacterized protein n=1 Tax=Eutreptiella gymnastica TaxID=73025 RepID=A0A7S4FTS6_9EUGL